MTEEKFPNIEHYTINGKHIHPKNYWHSYLTWLQFKSLIDLMYESVHSERRWSLPLTPLAKPIDAVICKRSNSTCHFHCLAGNSIIIFFSVCEVFISSWSPTLRGVMFTCRVPSLITCIQFRLFIKEHLTNWYKFCIDWWMLIFTEHFDENCVSLPQTVAKWCCIKLCTVLMTK